MERNESTVIVEDLGAASIETRGGAFISTELGGRLPAVAGIADDD